MKLVMAAELPGWYTTQPYVKSGYRRCCSFRECSVSVFHKHNETVNIWMHLPVSIALIPYLWWKMPPGSDNFMVYLSVFIGNIQILMTSALCHTYYCHSRTVHNACWFGDFIGMLTGVLAGGTGFAYYAFGLSKALMGIMTVLYVLLIRNTWRKYSEHVKTLPLTPREGFPEFVAPLATFVGACWITPLVTAKITKPEYTDNMDFVYAWNLSAACPIILMIGGLFQGTNFPERFTSIIGHSHQWWHLCCSVLTFVWVEAITSHHLARY